MTREKTANVAVVDRVVERTFEKMEAPVQVEITPVKEKQVRIKSKYTFDIVIGAKKYYFTAGEIYTVSENIKDILQKQGALDVL